MAKAVHLPFSDRTTLTVGPRPCKWAVLHESREDPWGNDKFSIDLVFDGDDPFIADFRKILDTLWADYVDTIQASDASPRNKKGVAATDVANPFREEYDKETEEPTGRMILKLARKATVKRKGVDVPQSVAVLDGNLNPIPKTTLVGNDSVVNVELLASPYYHVPDQKGMVRLDLSAVQVVELKEYTAAAPAGSSFSRLDGAGDSFTQEGGDDAPVEDAPQTTNF